MADTWQAAGFTDRSDRGQDVTSWITNWNINDSFQKVLSQTQDDARGAIGEAGIKTIFSGGKVLENIADFAITVIAKGVVNSINEATRVHQGFKDGTYTWEEYDEETGRLVDDAPGEIGISSRNLPSQFIFDGVDKSDNSWDYHLSGGQRISYLPDAKSNTCVEVHFTGTDKEERFGGCASNNLIKSGGGKDLVNGGRGNDSLLGGDGEDILIGGANNDRLDGGAQNDVMWGGSGSDTFVFDDDGGGIDSARDFRIEDHAYGFGGAESYYFADDMIRVTNKGGDSITFDWDTNITLYDFQHNTNWVIETVHDWLM